MSLSETKPKRVVIRLHTNNIPGNPQSRQMTVAAAFFNQFYQRGILDTDFVHTPSQIDHPKATCYVMIDVNSGNYREECLDRVPLECFNINYSGQDVNFERIHLRDIQRFSALMDWGGVHQSVIRKGEAEITSESG